MDLIQTGATIALLTLLAYFVMVNVLERTQGEDPIKTEGNISPGHGSEDNEGIKGMESDSMINNHLNLDANKQVLIEGINTDVGFHTRTTVGDPVSPGGENVTQLAVFDEQVKGVLPVNHDLFEKQANFGSDITNINQFYRNNPEVFDRSMTTAPDAAGWHTQSQGMFNKLAHESPNAQINAWNFEKEPLA
jgi:hypothetical protein